jgi:hypothetical protein
MEMFQLLRSYQPSEDLPYAITADWVGMSDPCAPSSKLREKKLRNKCPDKQIIAQDVWPNIKLHGIKLLIRPLIRLHGIKLQGIRLHGIETQCIMPHSTKLPNISGLKRDLFLPIIVVNPRPTNLGTLKSRRRMRMINTAGSYLFFYCYILSCFAIRNHCYLPSISLERICRY